MTMTKQLDCTVTFDAEQRAVLRVRGEVDVATVGRFREAALDAVRRYERLVFDLEHTMILDASGLRVLSAVLREARHLNRPTPVLRGVRPLLAKSLKITGLHNHFNYEPAAPTARPRRAAREAEADRPVAAGTLAAA
jgi:anti-anti-sigma factor